MSVPYELASMDGTGGVWRGDNPSRVRGLEECAHCRTLFGVWYSTGYGMWLCDDCYDARAKEDEERRA